MHKLREHKTINNKVNKDSQETNNIIRVEKNDLINGIKTKEKEVIERFKTEGENPEREIKTTNMQDQNNNKKDSKENQKMITITELESSKKEKKLIDNNIRVEKLSSLKKIPSIVKPFTNIIEIVEENPKWDKDTTKRQNKIKEKITKDAPIDKSKAKHKFFECSSPREIKNFVNITLEKGHKKDKKSELNTKEYIRKKRHMMAFFIPKFTIYVQSKTKKIIEIKKPDHRNKDIIKHRKLQIWKLIDIKNIFYTTNEIIEIKTKTDKYKKRNISEAEIHKEWKIKKLVKRTRPRCKAKILTKLIILNYTERGKRQHFISTVTLYLYFIL